MSEFKINQKQSETQIQKTKTSAKEKIEAFLSKAAEKAHKFVGLDFRTNLNDFIKENNVPEKKVVSQIVKGKQCVSDLNEIECTKVLDFLKECKELQDKLTKAGINSKAIFNCSSIFELSKSACKKCLDVVEHNAKSNKAELEKNLKIEYYCDLLDIDSKHLRSVKNSKNFIKAAEYALHEMQKSGGKITKAQAAKNAKDYTIALDYQWDSIDDFKKFQSKNKDGIRERAAQYMNRKSVLDKLGKFGSKQKLYYASVEYFKSLNKSLELQVRKKIASDPTNAKAAEEWFNKIYSQNLGKLIINTSGKDIEALRAAAEYVRGPMREQVLRTVLQKVGDEVSTEEKQKLADDIQKDGTVFSGLSNPEDAGKVQAAVIENQSELGAKETIENRNNSLVTFVQDMKASLKKIAEKILKGIKLTDEEQKIKDEYDTKLNLNAGAQVGITFNEEVKKEEAGSLIAKMNKVMADNNLENVFRDQQIVTEQLISSYKVTLSDKEAVRRFFNEVTNGNFSLVNQNYSAKLNPPADPDKVFTGAQDDLGYKTQQNQNNVALARANSETLIKTIEEQTKAEEVSEQYTVEPSSKKSSDKKETNTESLSYIETIRANGFNTSVLSNVSGSDLQILLQNRIATIGDAVKEFKKLSDSAKTLVVDTVNAMSNAQQSYVLNKTDNTTKTEIVREGDLDYEKLNLDLDITHKQLLEDEDTV